MRSSAAATPVPPALSTAVAVTLGQVMNGTPLTIGRGGQPLTVHLSGEPLCHWLPSAETSFGCGLTEMVTVGGVLSVTT